MTDQIITIQSESSQSSDSLDHHTQDALFETQLHNDLDQLRTISYSFVSNPNAEERLTPRTIESHKNIFQICKDSNSPLTLSANNSDNEDNHESHFRQLTLAEVEQGLDKHYDENDNKYSSELDILITYMKGQKNLFLQSHLHSQRSLNMLMVPALLISSVVTIFAPLIQEYNWSGGVISGLNAFIALLISLSNYYKLESSTQTFYNTALQYDKLETSLEFVASKIAFVEHDQTQLSELVFEKINDIEQKISEIKDWNPLFIPNDVRLLFPIISHINVFSFIKRIESNKKILIAKYKDVKNEIRYILHCFSGKNSNMTNERHEKRMQILVEAKDKIKEELGHYRNAYSYIDELFTIEIKNAEKKKKWFHFFKETCSENNGLAKYNETNPIVDKYMHYIFA